MHALARIGVDVTMLGIELHAQGLKAQDVHINLAGTQVAAAGHGDFRLAHTAQQRTENGRGSAHLCDELVRGLPLVDSRGIDGQTVLVHDLDRGAHALENLTHHMHVGNVGHIGKGGFARSKQGCGHELERGILSARNAYAPLDRMTTFNADDIQTCPFQKKAREHKAPGHDVHRIVG